MASGAAPGAKRGKTRLARAVFALFFAVSAATMAAVTVAVAAVSYFVYEKDFEEELLSEARTMAGIFSTFSEVDAELLSTIEFNDIRCTLISPDGTVLFDSWEDPGNMENHADREEVAAAWEYDQASTLRRSETLGTDALYAAVRLEDGTVFRLAETRTSLTSFLGAMAVPLVVSLVVITGISAWAARLLTLRIVKPLRDIDLSNPTENDAYLELQPLLERIDAQYRELEAQNRELEHANAMRREFTGNVSHEMKTPLQVIGGYAELMEGGIVAGEDVPRIAGLIHTESEAMRRLIDDVLTLSRLDEGACAQGEPVDLSQVCRDVVRRLEPAAQERGEIVRLSAPQSCMVRGTATLAQQLIYNLVDNAVRYNRDNGLVLVTLSVEGDAATVEVCDEGPGIPVEYRERVFERFFRVDSSRSRQTGGTGLGLAIVKHAASTFGGTVAIDESACGGARFVVTLPVDRSWRDEAR